jgi:peptidoglycan/LPS O-acetylase OafA/YrhL
LTVEECFYCLAPVFMLLARGGNTFAPLAFGAGLLGLSLGVSELGSGFPGTPEFVLTTTFSGHFFEFLGGLYLALAIMRRERQGSERPRRALCTVAGVAGVLVLIGAMALVYRRPVLDERLIVLINNFLIPIPIALLYRGLILEDTALARLLSGGMVNLLGRSSYSFYLLHALVIEHLSLPVLFPLIRNRTLCVLLTFGLTWCASIGLFLFFEEPVNRFLRRKLAPKSRAIALPLSNASP